MTVTDLETDFDLAAGQEAWAQLRPGITEVLYGRRRRKDGTVFPVEVHFGLLEGFSRPLYFACVRDITERQRTETVLRESAAHLRSAIHSMAEGFVLQTLQGRITDANPAAEVILGLNRDQLLGKTSFDPDWLAIREDESPFPGSEHPAMVTAQTGKPVRNQIMGIRDPKTGLRWISINTQPVFAAEGRTLSGVVSTFSDVTEQRRLAEMLRAARSDLQAVLDNVPARITSWLPDYTNRFANKVAAVNFGMEVTDMVGRHARQIIGEERFRRAKPYIDAALGGEMQAHEQIDTRPDGSVRHSRVSYVPEIKKGKVTGLYALATDISDLRTSRQRISNLAQRIDEVREDERRRVSRVLHERIAQDLFSMKLWINQLASESKIDVTNCEIDRAIASAIDTSIEIVRNLANELRPDMLAHLPLTAALNAYARQFSVLSGLQIQVTQSTAKPILDEKTRLAFFRAAQELLTNVTRHAHASAVEISLSVEAGRLVMEVADDGVGLDPADMNKEGSLGLLGIQERFASMGGTVSILGNRPCGTIVSISFPVEPLTPT